MRKWVDKYLTEIAASDPLVRLIIADVGDFPCFFSAHPEKFINVGVSESNAVGIAAGFASEGYHVYIYGVSSFFLYRAYEQFKYSIAYWEMPVTFIGVGFGWKYYNIGVGHFCPEDIGLVQMLPNFEIYTPFSLPQLKTVLSRVANAPRYLRLTASIVPYSDELDTIANEYVIISYGEMSAIVLEVTELLRKEGIDIGCVNFFEWSSLSRIVEKIDKNKCIIVEDQCSQCGLAPLLRERGISPIIVINLPIKTDLVATSKTELQRKYGLDSISICQRINKMINGKKDIIHTTKSGEKQ